MNREGRPIGPPELIVTPRIVFIGRQQREACPELQVRVEEVQAHSIQDPKALLLGVTY